MKKGIDPIQLEVFRNLFKSAAEEMGAVLRRTAYSPNIKERRDYSCAVFDSRGEVVAMGDHMPVHLGSMPLSVRAAVGSFRLQPGDLVILNDPFSGGTHLPDITIVLPVFGKTRRRTPLFFVASRAHHSDVGGMSPGSMPLSSEIFQEGIRIPPVKLYQAGGLNKGVLRLLLTNVRTPVEREGDLAAQVASVRVGENRLLELVAKYGVSTLGRYVSALHEYSQRMMEEVISSIPKGVYVAEDFLEGDGTGRSSREPIKIRVSIRVGKRDLAIDFAGSSPQVSGNLNAVRAITQSAVHYVLRCLAPSDIPNTAGLMRPVRLEMPEGTVINASYPAATAAGNVETSQRIVDTLLRAFSEALPNVVPAASSGTMNNLAIGGIHLDTGKPFSYYETIGGGMGAGPGGDGDSGIHTHMTNSLNTPIEALEPYFPFRLREYRLRSRSGGRGKYRGGNGIIRTFELLGDCEVTILSERRTHSPYGLRGGTTGKKGLNSLIRRGRRQRLPGKASLRASSGDILSIETPGGGGWGRRSPASPRRKPADD
jgi:N-methylhydantoinase B